MTSQRRQIFRWALLLGVLYGCSAGDPPAFPGGIQRAVNDPQLLELLRPAYRISRPASPGPWPAILFVPGCSGFSPPNYADRAARLVVEGYMIAHVDYLAAEGVADACAPGSITVGKIATYVLAAAADLRGMAGVTRVYAVGWSLGGGGVLASLGQGDPDTNPVTSVAALYPLCTGVEPWRRSIPALLMLGELDNITPPETCHDLVARAAAQEHVVVRTLSRAHHAFDAIELPIITEPASTPTVGYNPEAAELAWEAVLELFREGD